MSAMRAMVLDRPQTPLVLRERAIPQPAAGEILVEIEACGVCRTDLHVVDGELPQPKLPIVPGHEIVGRVAVLGADVTGFGVGERVGMPWLGSTCGVCPFCRSGRENLCDSPLFTGYTRDGGYATHTLANARFSFPLPRKLDAGEGGAFALRRPDRVAQLPHGRGGDDARSLWLRRCRAYFGPGRDLAGQAGLRLHSRRRCHLANIRAFARRSLGWRLRTRCLRNRSMQQLFLLRQVNSCRLRSRP